MVALYWGLLRNIQSCASPTCISHNDGHLNVEQSWRSVEHLLQSVHHRLHHIQLKPFQKVSRITYKLYRCDVVARLEVKDYLSHRVNASFLTFGLLTSTEELLPLTRNHKNRSTA